MQSSVRTIASAYLQTTQLLGLPVQIEDNSTLNEKFSIHENESLLTDEVPSVIYVGVGNGGHRMVVGADSISRPEPVLHTPQNASLYNHLPLVLRPITNDLTAAERVNYRLRRIETHDGVEYAAYYLKRIDLSTTDPLLELREVDNGNITSTPFGYSLSDLNPSPPALNPGGTLTTTGDYIAATAKVPFIMDSFDIEEFKEVANIIYGDVNYAMISEIALCSGVDRSLPGDFNGATLNYTDVVACQVANFITSFFSATFSNSGINVTFDIGSAEPLLVIN